MAQINDDLQALPDKDLLFYAGMREDEDLSDADFRDAEGAFFVLYQRHASNLY